MQPASAEDIAHFADCIAAAHVKLDTVPDMMAKLRTQDAEERNAFFAATWAAADTTGDDRLNAAEYADFAEKMRQNMIVIAGDVPEKDDAYTSMIFNGIVALCPGQDSISKLEYARWMSCVVASMSK